MVDAETPALTLATRGMVFAHVEVRTGDATGALRHVRRRRAERVPRAAPGARRGAARPRRPAARAAARRGDRRPRRPSSTSWKTLPGGAAELAGRSARARPTPRAAEEFYIRTTRRAVARRPPGRGRAGAHDRRARRSPPTCPCGSSRGQRSRGDRRATSRRCCATRCPTGAELTFSADRAEPSRVRPRDARRCRPRGGRSRAPPAEPALVRSGGTLPILAAFAERGIPAIVSGFSLPDDALHAPERVLPARRARAGRARRRARSTRSWPG